MEIFTPVKRRDLILFLGLFLILTTLPLISVLLQKHQPFFLTALKQEAKPTNVKQSNVGDQTATISWTSEEIPDAVMEKFDLKEQTEKVEFVEDEIMAKFKGDITKRMRPLDEETAIQSLEVTSLENVYKIKVKKGVNLEQLVKDLKKNKNIEYAEPNYIFHALETPNDPNFDKLWGLKKIEAEQAWEVTTGSETLLVAVLDTGLDSEHGDLKENVWINPEEIPNNGVDDDGNGFVDDLNGWNFIGFNNDPEDNDPHGHGTHVSGTIGAVGDNGLGVVGINWKIKLLPVKVLDGSGNGTLETIAAGIRYAADMGAKVINLSLGSSRYTRLVEDTVNYAHNKGSLIIAAAGNCGLTGACNNTTCSVKSYPAAYEKVIAVANTTPDDRRNRCSSFYPEVELAAPGTNIYSTKPQNGYQFLTGTSMAAPHVSGLAALILSHKPTLTNTALKDLLASSADDLGPPGRDSAFGHGRINARKALGGEVSPPPEETPPVCTFTADPLSGEVPLEVNFDASGSYDPDGGSIAAYDWTFGDDAFVQGITASHTYLKVGDYTVTLEITDDEEETSSCSQDIRVLERRVRYEETTGSIIYGTAPGNLDKEAADDRGEGVSSTTHHVTLSGLTPNTSYYYKIKSGLSLWGKRPYSDELVKNGAPLTFRTGPLLQEREYLDPVFGLVKDINGNKVSGAIVMIKILNSQNEEGEPLSYITREDGGFVIDLAKSRAAGNEEYFIYERHKDSLIITVNAGDKGIAEKTVKIPPPEAAVEDIILASPSAPPPQRHKICQENSCLEVAGPGSNECENVEDCLTQTHWTCQEKTCVAVEGPGVNLCTSDPECQDLTPRISELLPTEGRVEDLIKLLGENFGANGRVKFNTVQALINRYTSTQILTKVPNGLASGPVNVTVTVNEDISNVVPFTLLAPHVQITGVTPPSEKNSEVVNLRIIGLGYEREAKVTLHPPIGTEILEGRSTEILNSEVITSIFDLRHLATGTWKLRITNPDESFDEVPFVITAAGSTVNFKIKLQGIKRQDAPNKFVKLTILQAPARDFQVEVYSAGEGIYRGIVDVEELEAGTHQIRVKGPVHRSQIFRTNITIGQINEVDWSKEELKAGDINEDDIIESLDLAEIIKDFDLGKKVAPNHKTDLNSDLMVEALDLALVIANFFPTDK